jgi:hypothetical protein
VVYLNLLVLFSESLTVEGRFEFEIATAGAEFDESGLVK